MYYYFPHFTKGTRCEPYIPHKCSNSPILKWCSHFHLILTSDITLLSHVFVINNTHFTYQTMISNRWYEVDLLFTWSNKNIALSLWEMTEYSQLDIHITYTGHVTHKNGRIFNRKICCQLFSPMAGSVQENTHIVWALHLKLVW